MKFIVTCSDPQGHLHAFHYDNEAAEFISPTGIKVINSRSRPSRIRDITILLGSNCNLKCSYCFQQTEGLETATTLKENQFDNLITKIKSLDGIDPAANYNFGLWGGEPLLYFKTMQKLVYRLRTEFTGEKNKYYFSTNGLLLDKDKLQWCYDNDIVIQISDDFNNENRGQKACDGMPKIRALIRSFLEEYPDYAENVSCHTVLTKSNPDIYEIIKKQIKSYGPVTPSFGVIRSPTLGNTVSYDQYHFDLDSQRLLFTSIYKIINSYPKKLYKKIGPRACRFFTKCIGNESLEYACPPANNEHIVFGSDGEMYACRSSPFKKNIIVHDPEILDRPLHDVTSEVFIKTEDRNKCRDCFVRNCCRGMCSIVPNENIDVLCDGSFTYNIAIIYTYLQMRLGLTIVNIKNEDGIDVEEFSRLGNIGDYQHAKENYIRTRKRIVEITAEPCE